jgi:hypothetical protein
MIPKMSGNMRNKVHMFVADSLKEVGPAELLSANKSVGT